MTKKMIAPSSLVPMDLFTDTFPLRVEIAYARDDNLLFGERLYQPGTRLWLHEDFATIILLASKLLPKEKNLQMILYDGLRTTDAQALMLETKRVKDNPQWLEEPRLLSPPGAGGHPRGMAIDVSLEKLCGESLDMGTSFDFLAENSSAEQNPAHRLYIHNETITKNRNILDTTMAQAAAFLEIDLLPLPEEWWDFRLPRSAYEHYAPLSDSDLPPQMRLTGSNVQNTIPDFDEEHFKTLKEQLLEKIEPHLH